MTLLSTQQLVVMEKDSYAPMVVELFLQPPPDSASQEFLNELPPVRKYPSHDFFRSLNMTVHYGFWTGTLDIFDRENIILERLRAVPGVKYNLAFRFFWDNEDGHGPLFKARVTKIEPEYTPEGLSLKFDLLDAQASGNNFEVPNSQQHDYTGGVRAFVLDEQGGTRTDLTEGIAYFSTNDWRPSKIVETLAGVWNWRFVIQQSNRFPSDVTSLIIPANQTAMQFVGRELVGRAFDEDTKTAFVFYSDPYDVAVHFHSPLFIGANPRRVYNYARDGAGDVIEFTPEDHAYYAVLLGGGNATYQYIDSEGGTMGEMKSTSQRGLQNGAVSVLTPPQNFPDNRPVFSNDTANVPSVTAPGASPYDDLHVQSVPGRSHDDGFARARYIHALARSMTMTAKMRTKGSHIVTPFDFVDVRYFGLTPDQHHLSGKYKVMGLVHDVSASGWNTEYDLLRTGSGVVYGQGNNG